jgi:hypothetical protein
MHAMHECSIVLLDDESRVLLRELMELMQHSGVLLIHRRSSRIVSEGATEVWQAAKQQLQFHRRGIQFKSQLQRA